MDNQNEFQKNIFNDFAHPNVSTENVSNRQGRYHTGEEPSAHEHCNEKKIQEKSTPQERDLFKCEICCKTFSCISSLKRHQIVHTKNKLFGCPMCEKCFSRKEYLQRHIKRHTGEKPFTCKLCKKTFTQKCALTVHMRLHNGEKPFTCKECKKTFSQKSGLKVHMRYHTGEKPFSCKECEESFAYGKCLKVHMRSHTGEEPFTCTECKKIFDWKSSLKMHMKIHTGEKLFICSECEKKFTQKVHLVRHMRCHTGDTPFRCDQYEMSNLGKGNLEKHMEERAGEKSFSYAYDKNPTDNKKVHSKDNIEDCQNGSLPEECMRRRSRTNTENSECMGSFASNSSSTDYNIGNYVESNQAISDNNDVTTECSAHASDDKLPPDMVAQAYDELTKKYSFEDLSLMIENIFIGNDELS